MKVLDFGLAKAMDRPSGSSCGRCLSHVADADSPAMTQAGMILGTAAYMSPEQARGKRGRQAHRHLGVRLRALRDADRPRGVRRRRRSPTSIAAVLDTRARLVGAAGATPPHRFVVCCERCLEKDRSGAFAISAMRL